MYEFKSAEDLSKLSPDDSAFPIAEDLVKRLITDYVAESHTRRPHSSPNTKVGKNEEQLILYLRSTRNLGARRIQTELRRLHAISLNSGLTSQAHRISTARSNALRRRIKLNFTQPLILVTTICMTCWPSGSTTTTGSVRIARAMVNDLWSATLTWLMKHPFLMRPTRSITRFLSVYRIQITE